jgi:hypothetical protein
MSTGALSLGAGIANIDAKVATFVWFEAAQTFTASCGAGRARCFIGTRARGLDTVIAHVYAKVTSIVVWFKPILARTAGRVFDTLTFSTWLFA